MNQNIIRGALMALGFALGLALPFPWFFSGIALIWVAAVA